MLHFWGYSGHVIGIICWLIFRTSMGLVKILDDIEAIADDIII